MGALDKLKGCVETGASYGAQGAALGGTVGAAAGSAVPGAGNVAGAGVGAEVGLKIGGLYGCYRGLGYELEDLPRLARKAWRKTRNLAGKVGDWVSELLGLSPKPRRRQPPPTPDEAMVLLIESFKNRPGPQFHMQGSDGVWRAVNPAFALHHDTLDKMYGSGGVVFDPEGLFDLLWRVWDRSTREFPAFSDAGRLIITQVAVGSFLEFAPEVADIDRWPLMPRSPVTAGDLIQAAAPETGEEASMDGGNAEPPPELLFWGVLSILSTRKLGVNLRRPA